jgi:hypothetical protein
MESLDREMGRSPGPAAYETKPRRSYSKNCFTITPKRPVRDYGTDGP